MSDKKGMDPKTYKFDTLSLHAGYQPHKNAGSRQVPIYQTTSYLFDDVDHAAALFNLERGGHIYSRISNHLLFRSSFLRNLVIIAGLILINRYIVKRYTFRT